jgi:hypothetical protein
VIKCIHPLVLSAFLSGHLHKNVLSVLTALCIASDHLYIHWHWITGRNHACQMGANLLLL